MPPPHADGGRSSLPGQVDVEPDVLAVALDLPDAPALGERLDQALAPTADRPLVARLGDRRCRVDVVDLDPRMSIDTMDPQGEVVVRVNDGVGDDFAGGQLHIGHGRASPVRDLRPHELTGESYARLGGRKAQYASLAVEGIRLLDRHNAPPVDHLLLPRRVRRNHPKPGDACRPAG